MTTIQNLLDLLSEHGGKIIKAVNTSKYEVEQAKASERFYTDEKGSEFIWEPSIILLPETDEAIELFTRWYPIEAEPKEGFYDELWNRITASLL